MEKEADSMNIQHMPATYLFLKNSSGKDGLH
jgi:hypothetical protein